MAQLSPIFVGVGVIGIIEFNFYQILWNSILIQKELHDRYEIKLFIDIYLIISRARE